MSDDKPIDLLSSSFENSTETEKTEEEEEEEKDRKQVAEWFLNQNADNSYFRESIAVLSVNMESVYSEMDAMRRDNQNWGAEIVKELQIIRQEIENIKEGKIIELINDRNQCLNNFENQPCLISLHSNIHKTNGNTDEMQSVQKMIQDLKSEIESLKDAHKKQLDTIRKYVAKELDTIRSEFSKRSLNSVSETSKDSTSTKPSVSISSSSIKEDIVGEWKLVRQRKLTEFCRKNEDIKHEVCSQNLKFELSDDTLSSFFRDNDGLFRRWRTKQIGSRDNRLNRWFIEDNCIVTHDSTGAEKCTYSMRNDKLHVINSLKGISCSRLYDRIL